VVYWENENKINQLTQESQNMSKQFKGIWKGVVLAQKFMCNPPPHLKGERLDKWPKSIKNLRETLSEQKAILKPTNLDALFDTVMDQEDNRNISKSQIEAIPEPDKEASTNYAEEPQTEEALQQEDGHILGPKQNDNSKISKSPQEGASTLLRSDKSSELVLGIEEIPTPCTNAVDDGTVQGAEWPHQPPEVVDLLKILQKETCKMSEAL